MNRLRRCECCGQTLPEIRLGTQLSPLKAAIFDAVKAAPHGIEAETLFDRFIAPRVSGILGRRNLKAHIFQINEAIEDSGYQLFAGSGSDRSYRLVRLPPA